MVYSIFDKITRPRISVNEQLADELHKPVIKKLKRSLRDLKKIFGHQI